MSPAHDASTLDWSAPFEALAVGQSFNTRGRTVTEADVVGFAALTGDWHSQHTDAVWAAGSAFGERIAHGMLVAGFVSAALAGELPGPGTVYLAQSLRFARPVKIGDVITVRLEVLEVTATRRRVRLATVCTNQRDEVVVDGEATVMVPA